MSDNMLSKYDAVIVGCGVSGSLVGAILSSLEHKKVLVLERSSKIGGRSISFRGEGIRESADFQRVLGVSANTWCYEERCEPELPQIIKGRLLDGYVLEAGARAGWFTNKGKVSYILSAFNKPTIFYPNVGFVWFDEEWKPYNVIRGTRYGWMTDEDYAEQKKVTKRMLQIPSAADAAQFDHVSLKDWCEQITSNEKALEWHFNLGTAHTYQNAPALISAGENIKDVLMSRDMEVHITKGGWSFAGSPGHRFIVEGFSDVVREAGGHIVTNAKAKEISLQNGKATGVVVEIGNESREVEAPIVVSTVPAEALLGLLPASAVSEEFRKQASRTYNAGVVSINLGLTKPLHAFCKVGIDPRSFWTGPKLVPQEEGYSGNVPIIGCTHSSIAPTVAPEGKHLCWLGSNITDYEVRDRKKLDNVINRMMEFTDVAFPGWRSALEWKLVTVTNTAFGAKYVEDERVNWKEAVLVEGLYLAGETAGGIGIDNAAYSGLTCAETITGKEYLSMLPPALQVQV